MIHDPSLFLVFKPCDPQDCSGNGKCDKGQCVCEEGWKGTGCEKGDVDCSLKFDATNILSGKDLQITYQRGINDGSESDFIGLYSQFR